MNRDNNSNIKGFPMLLLSLIPGAAHMYMGLMKRGVQILLCFAVCVGIMSSTNLGHSLEFVLLPLAFIIFVYSFFDGYSCRRQIRSGVQLPDEGIIEEVKGFAEGKKINKYWLGIVLAVLGVMLGLDALSNRRIFIYSVTQAADFMLDILPAALLLVLGIVLIVRNKNNKQVDDTQDEPMQIPEDIDK